MYSWPFKKPYAVNLLVMSDLTLAPSFKVKLGRVSIKVPIPRLWLVLEVSNVQSAFRKPYAANLLEMSDLTFDPSFKVQLGWVSIKVPLSCLLLVLEVCNALSTFRKSFAENLLVVSPLTLNHQGQTMATQHKSACYPRRSFKHKSVATSIKLPLSCVFVCNA